MPSKISIILPCQNERETIDACITEIQKTAKAHMLNVEIIVSDSSKDGSDDIAKNKGAKVIKHDTDGYGFAIREGVRNATGEIIIYADSDNTYQFSDMPKLLKELGEGTIVIGSRFKGVMERGAMPLLHRFLGTPIFNILLFIFFGVSVSDSQSGFRAMRRETFNTLNLKTNGMEFATEMIIKARGKNISIKEVPIEYGKRKGTSKLRRYRDGFAHLKYICLQIPLSAYGISGTILFLCGVAGLLWGKHINSILDSATVKILFPILGIQILFLGLFAKTYLAAHLGEENAFMKKFYLWFHLPSALMLGVLLFFMATALKFSSVGLLYFDALLILVLLGLQIIFNSIILSILSIKNTV